MEPTKSSRAGIGRWSRWLAIGALASILAIAAMRALGMQDAIESASAVLAGMGVVAGLAIKDQSERRLEHEYKESQERLRLDAAMRAGSLLGGTDTAHGNPAAAASALLALAELERVDLAVALLADLWPIRLGVDAVADDYNAKQDEAVAILGTHESLGRVADTLESSKGLPGRVSTETAILVVDAALRSRDANAQLVAAGLLCRHAHDLDPCDPLHWPSSIDSSWDTGMSAQAKVFLADALVTMVTKNRYALDEAQSKNALVIIAVRLWSMWNAEDEGSHAKSCFGILLQSLQSAITRLKYDRLVHNAVEIDNETFVRKVSGIDSGNAPNDLLSTLARDRAKRLAAWSGACRTMATSGGALVSGA